MKYRSPLGRVLFLLLIFAGAVTTNEAAEKRSITDLFSFVWTGDAQFSPDGSRVTFGRVR